MSKNNIEIDLKQWMPSWGENSLSISYSTGSNLEVKVAFDGKSGREEAKVILFKKASFYSVETFPGVPSISHAYKIEQFDTGCVIEPENSTLSEEWRLHWKKSGLERKCTHYVSFWSSENKVIHVIAEGAEVIVD